MKLTDNLYFYREKGMLDSNTYVIRGNPSIIVDPGSPDYLPALVQDLHQDGIQPEDIDIIVNTHLHGDHYWGNEPFKKISRAKILCHPVQKQHWNTTVVETANFFGLPAVEFTPDGYMDDSRLNTDVMDFEIILSPGHSPDCICFYCRQEQILICGDVLFNQNTGRADLPSGSANDLKRSIDRLSQLPIDYLLPGHMNIIVGAENVRRNFEFIKEYVFKYL